MYNNHISSNQNPLKGGYNSNLINGRGGNNVTIRGNELTEFLPTSRVPSRNMGEASLKALRFYRRVCRMIPFLLRIHNLQSRVSETQAKINLGLYIRKWQHLRDPSAVDMKIYKGYEILTQAEWHYCQREHLFQFFTPEGTFPSHEGYSYLEQEKFKGKSQFLQGFYKGNQPTDY